MADVGGATLTVVRFGVHRLFETRMWLADTNANV
jgi:hypothetical protein